MVAGKRGLEIGGPSGVFRANPLPIYDHVLSLDNCDISQKTAWADHAEQFAFCAGKSPGRNIFCDGSNLSTVADSSYEFILSSHNLEHFANPIKALKEWQRVTTAEGSLILVLPHHKRTFDHRREPTPVSHMQEDFERDTQEDDLTHLEEITHLHDLSMDLPAGSAEQFRRRSLENYTNRCLHHHVFDEVNSSELLTSVGMKVRAVATSLPAHIILLAQMS